eukprot:scaffold288964_cov27-Tisochrysis_lutea.AAC.2
MRARTRLPRAEVQWLAREGEHAHTTLGEATVHLGVPLRHLAGTQQCLDGLGRALDECAEGRRGRTLLSNLSDGRHALEGGREVVPMNEPDARHAAPSTAVLHRLELGLRVAKLFTHRRALRVGEPRRRPNALSDLLRREGGRWLKPLLQRSDHPLKGLGVTGARRLRARVVAPADALQRGRFDRVAHELRAFNSDERVTAGQHHGGVGRRLDHRKLLGRLALAAARVENADGYKLV